MCLFQVTVDRLPFPHKIKKNGILDLSQGEPVPFQAYWKLKAFKQSGQEGGESEFS
jgi:hypothetical protein